MLRCSIKTLGEKQVLTNRLLLTSDGSTPWFYNKMGFTDHLIRIALQEGVDPVAAYRMVTLNPAVYFGLDHEIGGIAPGRQADILVLQDLLSPTPEQVLSKGVVVAERGTLLKPFPPVDWERFFPPAEFLDKTGGLKSDVFETPCEKPVLFPTVKLISSVITRTKWVEFACKNGFLDLHSKPGFCHVALLSRKGQWVANGILQGFGHGIEGLASSFNTATEILAIGRKTGAMCAAVSKLGEMGGGVVAVENGETAFELPLPLGGFMSQEPIRELAKKEEELKSFLKERGYPFHDPLFTLIFLPNDFLPEVRVNYRGVLEVKTNQSLWPRRDLGRRGDVEPSP